jgi:hypothetical protein
MVEYRITKRVQEQHTAFMEGFNELIPQELVNVFDERELELLIGGISESASLSFDVDMNSQCSLQLMWMIGLSSRITAAIRPMIRSSNGSGNAFAAGLRSASRACCSSLLALPG